MIMRMEQLRCLVDIAETCSITNTAQRLFMTQQAVSSRMKQLEQDLGVEILVRSNAGVYLTKTGEEILEYAKQILNTEEKIEQLCKRKQEAKSGEIVSIRVCSTSSVANIVLPDIVAKLNNQHKRLSLKIELVNEIDDLFDRVQSGQCDIGFLTYNEEELQRKIERLENTLQLEMLVRDELIAVMDRKFYKAGQDMFMVEECREHILTLYNIVSIDGIEEAVRQETMVSSNDADFHRRMIEKAGAVVLMPVLAYQYFFSSKKYIGLPVEYGNVPLVHAAVYRNDADERLEEFVAMIRRELYVK